MKMLESDKWDIIPGKSVGKFRLGTTQQEIKEIIDFNYEIREHSDGILAFESEMIDLYTHLEDDEYKLFQIAVKRDFPGKIINQIGIGSTLSEYQDCLMYAFDEEMLYKYHIYYFISAKYPGVTLITEKPWDDNTKVVRITVEDVVE